MDFETVLFDLITKKMLFNRFIAMSKEKKKIKYLEICLRRTRESLGNHRSILYECYVPLQIVYFTLVRICIVFTDTGKKRLIIVLIISH